MSQMGAATLGDSLLHSISMSTLAARFQSQRKDTHVKVCLWSNAVTPVLTLRSITSGRQGHVIPYTIVIQLNFRNIGRQVCMHLIHPKATARRRLTITHLFQAVPLEHRHAILSFRPITFSFPLPCVPRPLLPHN